MARIQYWNDDDAPITESVVISRVESALDHVLEDLGLDKNQSSVKPEKYVFLTVREFSDEESPITYSWFKWGASALAGPGGDRTSKTLETNTSSAEEILQTDLSELERFIKEGDHRLPIETWWDKERLEFLKRFYEEYAPPEYRNLYLSNIGLQGDLEFVQSVVQREEDLIGENTYRNIVNHTSGLEQGVRNIDGVSDEYPVVKYFNELFRDTVLTLAEISGGEIQTGRKTAVSELEGLYNELVWPLIAHKLSLQSAHGPNIDAIHSWSSRNYERLNDEFKDDKTKEICGAVELLREFKNYPNIDDQTAHPPSEPDVRQVLDSRTEIPEIEEFIAEHGLIALANLVDLAFDHANGEITYRGVGRALSIPPNDAFEMLEVIVPVITETPGPQTITPEDIDSGTREKLLQNESEQ